MILGIMNPAFLAQAQSAGPKTATPTVGTPFCLEEFGYKMIYVGVTNNDTSTATIYANGANIGQAPGSTYVELVVDGGVSLNYSYNINFVAQASAKSPSDIVNKTGTVIFCILL